MNQWQSWIWPGAIAAVLIAALGYAYWPRAVPVDMVTAIEAPMTVTVEDDGVTRVRESYIISAPVAGRVLRIETHVGDEIIAGKTVVAQIIPADPALWDARTRRELEFAAAAARAARDLAAASIKAAEARLTQARQELERTRQLFAKGHVAKARLDLTQMAAETAAADVATAQAALRQREFNVRTAEAALMAPAEMAQSGTKRFYDVRSPVRGRVLRIIRESEGVIQAGQPLVEIGDPANIEIVLDLLSTDAVKVAAGQAVEIRRWGADDVLTGQVRRVEPAGTMKVSSLGIEEQRVNVLIDITAPHERWARLGHGYQVDAAIVLWRAEKALQIPVGVLFRDGVNWAVFVVREGRAAKQIVAIGRMNETAAEIVQGLSAGDAIITHPSDRVQDGIRVTARE